MRQEKKVCLSMTWCIKYYINTILKRRLKNGEKIKMSNIYYSNEVDSNETLPLPDSSVSEVGRFIRRSVTFHSLPHSIIRGDKK